MGGGVWGGCNWISTQGVPAFACPHAVFFSNTTQHSPPNASLATLAHATLASHRARPRPPYRELFTGRAAFERTHYGEVFERVAVRGERPPVPDAMPDPYALLMTSCWAADPAERPDFAGVRECLRIMLREASGDGDGDGAGGEAVGSGGVGGGGAARGRAAAAPPAANGFIQDL